jgi:hypothetical protein
MVKRKNNHFVWLKKLNKNMFHWEHCYMSDIRAYRFIISSAISLMYPPSIRPGVSIMFNVKPALDRDTITGLGPSDFSRLKKSCLQHRQSS